MKEKTFDKYKAVIDEWLSNGKNGTAAYRSIYPNSSDTTCASEFNKILRIPKVKIYQEQRQRILNDKVEQEHGVSIDSLLFDTEKAKVGAMAKEDYKAFAALVNVQAKIIGAYQEHNKQKTDFGVNIEIVRPNGEKKDRVNS